MTHTYYGYTGRLLRVQLSERRYTVENIPVPYLADFIGGRGLAARYLYDEVGPGIDPLGPENRLIFSNGPLSGTRMPSSGRFVVSTLSPATKIYTRAVSGGAWGAYLKFAGYDLLILEGQAPEWCYLYITADGVEFRDARKIIGLLTDDAEAAIAADLGNQKVKTCVIGPAGEKQVCFAAIQTERRSAARGGIGAVMGSKRVKGIAVYGSERPRLYDPDTYNEQLKQHVRTNVKCEYYRNFHDLGTTGGVGLKLTYAFGVHPVKNYRETVFPEVTNIMAEAIRESGYKTKETGCWNCYMKCGSIFDVPDGKYRGKDYESPEYETVWAFGANVLNHDFSAILAANKICDDYGIDTVSAGSCVAFFIECFERGYITAEDLGGVRPDWGDTDSILAIVRQFGERNSRAAEWVAVGGVRHAAAVIGHDAADFAIHSKGMELPGYDPRGLQAHGLGYATSNIGGSHQIGYSAQELFGYPEKVDRFSDQDKGRHTVFANQLISIYDCAVSCGFANAFTESRMDVPTFARWLRLATGLEDAFRDAGMVNRAFDRIYHIERAFNIRQGATAADDTLPRRLLKEPLKEGPSAGHVWKREALIRDYYRVRGWDLETGVPLRSTLVEHGLGDVADDLEREGYLPKAAS
jgi:aldehyde:ferredoxin oxidoreductase